MSEPTSAVFASLGQQVAVAPGGAATVSASHITARLAHASTSVRLLPGGGVEAAPATREYALSTRRRVARTGVMVVGLCGNNGSTLAAGLLAHKLGLEWRTRAGVQRATWIGSLTQASTVRLGQSAEGRDVFVPFSSLLPMLRPEDLVVGGWDISALPLAEAVERAQVLDVDLQRQLAPHMREAYGAAPPLPSIYYPHFIAANQRERADNLLLGGGGSKAEHVDAIRAQIRAFKKQHELETVIVFWSANTERFCDVRAGLNDSAEALLASIVRNEAEVSPSTVFAVAAVTEGCCYLNGSPQNTFVPGLIELATRARPRVFLGGDDLKSGQTRLKTVLVDYLVGAGLKPTSIVSYNHLGNNDGRNLSEAAQFKSKEISKSSVLDDSVASNGLLYAEGEKPDHVVVIKYVPSVGDSKRALDEYTARIFLGGSQTLSIFNVCEDSLLAAPIMLDLVLLTELFTRVSVSRADAAPAGAKAAAGAEVDGEAAGEGGSGLHTVLSLLSYLFKAPIVPAGAPVINALHRQRDALVNFMRALIGLPPDSSIDLEQRLTSEGELERERESERERVPVVAAGVSPA